jgi:opacity protein-like surface antigen
MRTAPVVLAVLACATIAPPARAAESATGFYVGAGAGVSRYDIDFSAQVHDAYAGAPFTVASAGMTDRGGTAATLFAGWQFHRHVAVEAAYAWLGKAGAAYTLDRFGTFTRDAEYEASAVTLALVGSWPVHERFTLLVKGGVAFTRLEYRETGADRGEPHAFDAPTLDQTRGMAGLGATYAIAPQWTVRGEWDRYFDVGRRFALNEDGNGRFDAIDAFWVGVQYRF